ncbi:hypothetical protein N7468_009705, partial [Penicillium chermesinum]
ELIFRSSYRNLSISWCFYLHISKSRFACASPIWQGLPLSMDQLSTPASQQLSGSKVEVCSRLCEGSHVSPLETPAPEPQSTFLPTTDREPPSVDMQEQGVGPSNIPKMANSAPLGLCAFALTSFVSNFVNIYAHDRTFGGIDVGLPLAYGGLAQMFAGIWEMAVGNTFGATSFCSYGAYWITSGIMSAVNRSENPSRTPSGASNTCSPETLMGAFHLAWFIFTTLMLLCTLKSSIGMFLLFFFLDMNYLLLGIAHLRCDSNGDIPVTIQRCGGVFGILASFAAWYNALAGLFDEINGFFVVPLGQFPWSPAARAHRSRVKKNM